MNRRQPELRKTLSVVTAVVTLLVLAVMAALLLVTARLRRASADLGGAVEGVRLAEEAQIDLLLHARTEDPIVRRQIEDSLDARLAQASGFVTTPHEEEHLRAAKAAVDAYVADARVAVGAPSAASLEAAYAGIEALADVNVEEARARRERAAAWQRVARALVIGSAGALVALAGAMVWWLNTRAFEPVFALARAMRAFGLGQRGVRAEETGPAELRDMAARFNEMADALAEQREGQMAFLAGVAHDLRGPLSTLRLAVEVAGPDRPLGSEEDVRRTLALVGRQITRLERMVGDFLDRARIEAGQLELSMTEVDLRGIVGDVAELFRPAAAGHRIEVTVPAEPVVIRCDALRIEQVVTNLVSNAVKYSPGGGVVRVALRDGEDGAEIEVADEGVGIPEAERARVFEPFRRVGERRRAIPGVGLGLFVSRQIVEAHGGRIEVESGPRRGTVFRVRLARARPALRVVGGSSR